MRRGSAGRMMGLWGVIFAVACAPQVLAQTPDSLERQVRELVLQNRMLTERLNQVEQELRAMKVQRPEGIETTATKVDEEGSWYDQIEIGVGATGVVQGASYRDGGQGRKGGHGHATGSVDLEVGSAIGERGSAFMLAETGDGEGIDANFALGGVNGDAIGDKDFKVSELWYEHVTTGEAPLRFRIGKLDLSTDFDTNEVANDETTQFLSGPFINNVTVEFPEYCFGAMLWLQPSSSVSLGLGFGDADADWNDVLDRPFGIAELGLHPKVGTLQGNYRIYGWMNSRGHATWHGGSDEKGYGFGLSLDQKVTPEVTAFARYGYAAEDVKDYAVGHAISAGLQVAGGLWQRPSDVVALAWGVGVLNEDHRAHLEATGLKAANEHRWELYYSYQVNDRLAVTPDFQYCLNPNGRDDGDDLFVFGVRGQVNF